MTKPLKAYNGAQFHLGTENYYQYQLVPRFKYTDGVQYVASKFGAYWLVDIAMLAGDAIYKDKSVPVDQKHLLVFKLKVNDDDSFVVTCEDGNNNVLDIEKYGLSVKGDYTNFPAQEQVFWLQNGVLLLPDEY